MIKKLQNITNKLYASGLIIGLILIWQVVCSLELVPGYMLPSPIQVIQAFINEFNVLMGHLMISLSEAFLGLGVGILVAFILAVGMDHYRGLHKSLYPLLIISQTVPVIAIAPLLVLWMGYGMAPKVMVIFLVCFFPITISLLDGFREADRDTIRLMKSMGANAKQIFWHIKLPCALPGFLAGLKVSVSYAVIGAVVAEWLGGTAGLGVYMTRVRKSYAFDKMFAVIFLVSLISLVLMKLVSLLDRKIMPYKRIQNKK
ncbi:ABC transporter permease [Zhenhengia yiwuensis]|uniref:ABC transporter permease n=1 Tax=Zhenhengia yiwuensis TaxID=2763666 RepID=UPI002A75740F|nr:ABC transporter permease [Zhenhengia yiwuensis]MDY3367050.1 ABC transporter permease [Zhenhengia yiwuensis]